MDTDYESELNIGDTEWDLPKNWEDWSTTQKLNWHQNRVQYEEPVFNMFRKVGLISLFTREEIAERLHFTRAYRKRVEAALLVATSPEFKQIWEECKLLCIEAQKFQKERANLQKLQFRRTTFKLTDNEEDQMTRLKIQACRKYDEAEVLEGKIMDFCEAHGADPVAYLIVDDLRGNMK